MLRSDPFLSFHLKLAHELSRQTVMNVCSLLEHSEFKYDFPRLAVGRCLLVDDRFKADVAQAPSVSTSVYFTIIEV